MMKLLALLAPAALMGSSASDGLAENIGDKLGQAPPSAQSHVSDKSGDNPFGALLGLDTIRSGDTVQQVRIQRRVTIRITPRSRQARQRMMTMLPNGDIPDEFAERKIGKCLPMRGIAGVQTGAGSRLLLFMRDQRIISAELEKACKASAFYSGFYIEPSKDGDLCVRRDELRSRSGTICEIGRIRQLVRKRE